MAKVALLIGVSEYEPGLNPLPAAAKDVEAMQEVLMHPEIGGFDQVTPLPNPDLLTMRNKISELFNDRQEDDLLLLYFSGHGITDEFGKFYFTNRNTQKYQQRNRLNKATAVEASFVHDQMEYCNANRLVVILDCCNSGAFGENIPRDEGTIDFKQQLGGEGRIVLTSSSAIEYSFERQGEDLAIYTRYLVEGIKTGAADLDEDGSVSVNELHEYVKTKLKKAAPSMHPERYVSREGEKIILTKAVVSDPKRSYRKEVQKRIRNGKLSSLARRSLRELADRLGLSIAEATAIEAGELKPYQEFQQKLTKYQDAYQEAIEEEFPLTEETRLELQDYQQVLGLRDQDVQSIQAEILADFEIEETIAAVETELLEVPPKSSPTSRSNTSLTVLTFEFDIVTVELQKSGFLGQKKKILTQTRPGRAEYFTEDFLNLAMVSIPGGTFTMGSTESEREKPPHKVTIAPFFMSKYPITQAQWSAIASLPKINLDLNPDPSTFKGANRPVEQVSWNEAVEFCDRLSKKTGEPYRLPSEAEWEYACRAGTTAPFHFGETIKTGLANYDGNHTYGEGSKGIYRKQTTDVGSFPPNAFGLYDMHGNVWEWCADPWHENYNNAPADSRVWELSSGSSELSKANRENASRLLRGGSWINNPTDCRSAYRYRGNPDDRSLIFGFRVLCSFLRTP